MAGQVPTKGLFESGTTTEALFPYVSTDSTREVILIERLFRSADSASSRFSIRSRGFQLLTALWVMSPRSSCRHASQLPASAVSKCMATGFPWSGSYDCHRPEEPRAWWPRRGRWRIRHHPVESWSVRVGEEVCGRNLV